MEYNLQQMSEDSDMGYEELARMIRNGLLTDSDWTQLPDAPITSEKREEWKQWRQYLRDLPTEFADTANYPSILTITNSPE